VGSHNRPQSLSRCTLTAPLYAVCVCVCVCVCVYVCVCVCSEAPPLQVGQVVLATVLSTSAGGRAVAVTTAAATAARSAVRRRFHPIHRHTRTYTHTHMHTHTHTHIDTYTQGDPCAWPRLACYLSSPHSLWAFLCSCACRGQCHGSVVADWTHYHTRPHLSLSLFLSLSLPPFVHTHTHTLSLSLVLFRSLSLCGCSCRMMRRCRLRVCGLVCWSMRACGRRWGTASVLSFWACLKDRSNATIWGCRRTPATRPPSPPRFPRKSGSVCAQNIHACLCICLCPCVCVCVCVYAYVCVCGLLLATTSLLHRDRQRHTAHACTEAHMTHLRDRPHGMQPPVRPALAFQACAAILPLPTQRTPV
jgi:hypothetical protein